MSKDEVLKIVSYIAEECIKLKNKYVSEKNLEIDYVAIFTQNETEYNNLYKQAESLGRVVGQTPTGDLFAFHNRPVTSAGKPKLLKIRKPDATRPQRGDADFNTDYEEFKEKYLDNNRFTLIKRENFEMIELKDKSFDVLVYFSSIPVSQQLGIE